MLLAIDFDGDLVTLARSLRGGNISVFDGDIRQVPDQVPDQVLLGSHKKNRTDTISYFLLNRLGIADTKLRKNKRNETVALSFRNLAHLVIIGEERMHSRTSPIESGNYTTRTTELSALKLLLEGEDDSGLTSGEDPAAFRRINRAQLAVLERAVAQASSRLTDASDRGECVRMLARINEQIQMSSTAVSAELRKRDQAISQLDVLKGNRRRQDARASEAAALVARFSLLDTQYEADMERLRMVKSAGTLLGYFDAAECVFCGATTHHQRRDHAVYETVQLTEAIDAESLRTRALREDLASTLTGLGTALAEAKEQVTTLDTKISAGVAEIHDIERRIRPAQEGLEELLARRSQLERWITLWDQVAELQTLSATVAQEQPETADPVTEGIGKRSEIDFSAALRNVLTWWGVPEAERAEFVLGTPPDVVLQGRPRADRGKGIRSVLHAGFSAALGEYCLERELPHPGFVVFDTPVLTYRDADTTQRQANEPAIVGSDIESTESDELMAQTVADAFYDYLAASPVQSIILENQTPPEVTAEGCEVIYFTGSATTGRPGFYPTAD
ncbi:hypothetical protein HNP00_003513 [Arthrobacter sp. AZCC_0090]|nr:hypothetical protein [Arthrobacter sp. AZCC_0090]